MELRIFGVRIDRLSSREELRERFLRFLREGSPKMVVTVNPEILVAAKRDPSYAEVLNRADLAIPDGVGVTLASRFLLRKKLRRFPGIDAAEILIALCAEEGVAVLFVGGRQGNGFGAAERFMKRHPSLRIFSCGDKISFRDDGTARNPDDEEYLRSIIREIAPRVIFVGLGAPKQERWIVRHRDAFPSARIIMAVGGAFDIWSGDIPRAPRILRAAGFEWLWRLCWEPKRFRRILRAVFSFPLLVAKEAFRR
jgi:N-acetylglucosaminyldiphosphoundecaprenol N-acetyl-beta-D-mannosaminyltransferase